MRTSSWTTPATDPFGGVADRPQIRAHRSVGVPAYLLERWVQRTVRERGAKGWAHPTGEPVLEEVREGRLRPVGIQGTDIRRWKVAGFSGEAELVLEKLGVKAEAMRVPTGLW